MEQQLAALFRGLLGQDEIGVEENFFDMGGTSLLALRLFADIERALGVSLPLSTLFRAPTIEALAALLESEHSADAQSVRTLSRGTEGAPLHLIHDDGGTTAAYDALVARLGTAARVYGIVARGEGPFPTLRTRIDDMAAHYAARIRQVQPRGPYAVGGHGMGGVLAHAVACRLQSLGQRVSLVALFDTGQPTEIAQAPRQSGVFPGLAQGIARRLRASAASASGSLTKSGVDYARVRLLRRYVDRGESPPWFLEHIPLQTIYRFALLEYAPARFDGRLVLFRSTASDGDAADAPARERTADPLFGWSSYATEGVIAIDVPGGHRSSLAEPHVEALAEHVVRELAVLSLGARARERSA
jgi:thioesterase domain-containing protein/acyl carrier protein